MITTFGMRRTFYSCEVSRYLSEWKERHSGKVWWKICVPQRSLMQSLKGWALSMRGPLATGPCRMFLKFQLRSMRSAIWDILSKCKKKLLANFTICWIYGQKQNCSQKRYEYNSSMLSACFSLLFSLVCFIKSSHLRSAAEEATMVIDEY